VQPSPPDEPTGFEPIADFPAPYAPPAVRPATRVTIGDALAAVGGLSVFLFSFGPFVGYDDGQLLKSLEQQDLPTWFSAWGLETFLAPLTWWVIFASLGLVGLVGLGFVLPRGRSLAGFRASQLKVGLALFGFLVLLGYALSAKTLVYGAQLQARSIAQLIDGDLSYGWGGYVMLLGAATAAIGALLDHFDVGPTLWTARGEPGAAGQPDIIAGQ
jgi:hypothetical protein